MSSRARFSAFFASVREWASGFNSRIALLRSIALSFEGAAQDLTSPARLRTSHIPFKAIELDREIVAYVKRGDAFVEVLKPRARIL